MEHEFQILRDEQTAHKKMEIIVTKKKKYYEVVVLLCFVYLEYINFFSSSFDIVSMKPLSITFGVKIF